MAPAASFSGGSSSAEKSSNSNNDFQMLKAICVPLLSNSLLTPQAIPRASALLSQLSSWLGSLQDPAETLLPSTISYIFFPLSHIFQRNAVSDIPDVIMEKLMGVMAVLFEQWWWTCPNEIWEQVLMLSAAILGGIDSRASSKGKKKDRDEETKRAAAQCLWSVLRRRSDTDTSSLRTASRAEERFVAFQACGREPKLLPILGQTLTCLLDAAQSANRKLQTLSLRLVHALITDYLPDEFMPSILPGIVSATAKVALGRSEGKGWANGDTVDLALLAMQEIIVRAIGDKICQAEGALRNMSNLDDLTDSLQPDGELRPIPDSPFFTRRTSVWLTASASQLHMALNTLSPLSSHPNSTALLSLARFSHVILSSTSQALPDTQPLFLSFLLSLSICPFQNVADTSRDHLLTLLLPPSSARFTLLRVLLQTTRDNLSALPRLLPSRSDAKVEHLSRQVSAACQLADHVSSVSDGVAKLLGPAGGIEKWGWSLLSAIELVAPPLFVSAVQPSQALLEDGGSGAESHPFPNVSMRYATSRATREALDHMFSTLGAAAGPDCVFAVEWFIGVARQGRGAREVAALWCAMKILEGVGGVSLEYPESSGQPSSKRVEKVAKWIAKVVAEFWDQEEDDDEATADRTPATENPESGDRLPLEYVKGLDPLITRFDLNNSDQSTHLPPQSQRMLHKVISLQLLSVTSAILQSQFMRLLLYTLYPVLHSLVAESPYLSSTALAALHYITSSTAYATPSNLLLANFDYALDGVARRLDRRQLDPEATKILVVLVRLVGKDIVSRASDVVEACFDRLDEFHGYNILVEGLVEVLAEVIKAVEADPEVVGAPGEADAEANELEDRLGAFLEWYQHRHDPVDEDQEDYGPAPREAWGAATDKGKDKEVAEDERPVPSSSDNVDEEPPPTPVQVLTQQIVSRSIYFLTHPSPLIRARILGLLDAACATLSEATLLPSVHKAWPYILNRLGDSEPFVVSAAASLIASLAEHVGEFMATRIWKDVWPRFRGILSKLEQADSQSALARRGRGAVGTESAYSHSHRLYTSLLRTMRAVAKGVQWKNDVLWEVLLAFRRFLHAGAHEDLQMCARDVYVALAADNIDAVWLMLSASMGEDVLGSDPAGFQSLTFLRAENWDIEANARQILEIA